MDQGRIIIEVFVPVNIQCEFIDYPVNIQREFSAGSRGFQKIIQSVSNDKKND